MIRPSTVAALAFAAGAAALAAEASAQAAGNAAKGREKIQMCAGCHGIEGYRTAFPEVYNVPRIGGQHESYLVKAMQAYKSGERNHPSMRAIAASLADEDIADLAAFYAQRETKTAAK